VIEARSRFRSVGEGRYAGSFDPSWNQGPGTFGGLLAATLGDALEREVPGRPLRTLSMQLCAPAASGPLYAVVQEERVGSAATFCSARLESAGKPVVIATAMLSRARTDQADYDHVVRPSIPAPDQLPEPGLVAGAPAFTRHFRFRFAHGEPFTGQQRPGTGGWVRPVVDQPLSTPLALALLDTWPLAILPTFSAPRPVASIAIDFHLFRPLSTGDSGWYQVEVSSDLNRQGYGAQVSSLWDEGGALLGRSYQLIALIR